MIVYGRRGENDTLIRLPVQTARMGKRGVCVSIDIDSIPEGVRELLVFPPMVPPQPESHRDICKCGTPRAAHIDGGGALWKAGIACPGFELRSSPAPELSAVDRLAEVVVPQIVPPHEALTPHTARRRPSQD